MSEVAGTTTGEPVERRSTGDYVGDYVRRIRAGDLGSVPIVIGIVIIAVVFQSLNANYLSAVNFVNLLVQMAGLATISMGVVFVLLAGEIDLSVSYVSGVGAVILARTLRMDEPLAWWLAVLLAVLVGVAIGTLQGTIITRAGVPSFVVTLAGLLGWNGLVLILIGGAGTVVIQDDVIVGVANTFLGDAWGWALAVVVVGGFSALLLTRYVSRTRAGLPTTPLPIVLAKIAGVALVTVVAVVAVNRSRGLPLVAILVGALAVGLTYLLSRTRYGRHLYAVGGNAEAARRAGIDVARIRLSVFVIASTMAVLGGIVLASRLRSVDTGVGGGNLLLNAIAAPVIGGTSLFGGRGRIVDALLGAIVIAGVDNGMGLLGLSAGARFVVTALILLAAVIVDSVARRGREVSGVA